MNRFFILVVTFVMLISLSSFFNNGVTVKMEIPDAIEAGTEITVNVTIDKGKLTGFARFQQDLPYGFTAMAVNSANADFSFHDQKVRLIWLRVPESGDFTATYKIVAHERLTGEIDLSGSFSYIENNERKSVSLQPKMLAITPSPNINPEMMVNVRDFQKVMNIESSSSQALRVASLRQNPLWNEGENAFLVTLLVNKDAIQKFAKIEETIPEGFTAVNIDSKGGIFTYKDQLAKFIWMDLPAEPYFTVSYKLIPDEGTIVNPSAMHVTGAFSYTVGNTTLTSAVVERNETLAGLTQAQVNSIIGSIEQPALIASNSSTGQQQQQQQIQGNTPVFIKDGGNSGLVPESGIYYRVQIAAGHKPLNPQRYFRKYKLDYTVAREAHDGWFKYSVGSFNEYKVARDYRVHLSNTTTLNDAFIAAYNEDKRITVQEALMALNQKWYK